MFLAPTFLDCIVPTVCFGLLVLFWLSCPGSLFSPSNSRATDFEPPFVDTSVPFGLHLRGRRRRRYHSHYDIHRRLLRLQRRTFPRRFLPKCPRWMRRCRYTRMRRAAFRRRKPPPMPTTHQFKTRFRSRPPSSKQRRRYRRRPLSGTLKVRSPVDSISPPVTFCRPTRRERFAIQADSLYRHRFDLLSSSDFVFGVCYGVDLDTFCSRLDPLAHFTSLRTLSDPTLLTSVSATAASERSAASTVRLGRRLARLVRCPSGPRANVAVASSLSSLLFQRENLPKVETGDPTNDILAGLYKQHYSNGVCFLEQNASDHTPVVIDSGASICLTPFESDFSGPIVASPLQKLTGLTTDTPVAGQGVVAWTVYDMFGVVRTIKVTAQYVPDASIRLFSPQQYFQERQAGSLFMNHSCATLKLADGSSLYFPYSHANLP